MHVRAVGPELCVSPLHADYATTWRSPGARWWPTSRATPSPVRPRWPSTHLRRPGVRAQRPGACRHRRTRAGSLSHEDARSCDACARSTGPSSPWRLACCGRSCASRVPCSSWRTWPRAGIPGTMHQWRAWARPLPGPCGHRRRSQLMDGASSWPAISAACWPACSVASPWWPCPRALPHAAARHARASTPGASGWSPAAPSCQPARPCHPGRAGDVGARSPWDAWPPRRTCLFSSKPWVRWWGDGTDITLKVVGRQAAREDVAQRVVELGLGAHVRLAGRRDGSARAPTCASRAGATAQPWSTPTTGRTTS